MERESVMAQVVTCLQVGRVMQLATVRAGRPWIATVYFVADATGRVYWLSLPTRRHSEDVVAQSDAAVAIAVKYDQPVIGVQASGTVQEIIDVDLIRQVMPEYVAKYGSGADFVERFERGEAEHRLYRFTPQEWWLFDELHYPGGKRQSVSLPLNES